MCLAKKTMHYSNIALEIAKASFVLYYLFPILLRKLFKYLLNILKYLKKIHLERNSLFFYLN
jgi:hypothetical protein